MVCLVQCKECFKLMNDFVCNMHFSVFLKALRLHEFQNVLAKINIISVPLCASFLASLDRYLCTGFANIEMITPSKQNHNKSKCDVPLLLFAHFFSFLFICTIYISEHSIVNLFFNCLSKRN